MQLCALQRLAALASQPCVVWEAAVGFDGAGGRTSLWWEQRFGDGQFTRLSLGEKACFLHDASQGSRVSVASLAYAVSYSPTRRNAISLSFPFINRMCKVFSHFPSPGKFSPSF